MIIMHDGNEVMESIRRYYTVLEEIRRGKEKIFGNELLEKMSGIHAWLSRYTENKINGIKYCLQCGKDLGTRKKKYCNDECRIWFWDKYNSAFAWQAIRVLVLQRDNYQCVECGKKDEYGERRNLLDVHHVIPKIEGGTNDLENLMTLCPECHKPKTRRLLQRIWKASESNACKNQLSLEKFLK